MSKTYRPWEPDQCWLLPPSPRDWLDEGDLVYFLLDTISELDINHLPSTQSCNSFSNPSFTWRRPIQVSAQQRKRNQQQTTND